MANHKIFTLSLIMLWAALGAGLVDCGGSSGPVTLASGEEQPSSIAAQDGVVYWLAQATATGAAAIRSIPAGGGKPTTVASVITPKALALGATQAIVASSGGNVYSAPLSGGSVTVLIPKSAGDPAIAVAVDGDRAYGAFNSGRVAGASISGGVASVVEIGFADNAVQALAADASKVYWLTSAGDVWSAAGDGSAAGSKLATAPGATSLLSLGGALYAASAQEILQIALPTGALSQLAQAGASCPPPRACTDAFWALARNQSSLFYGDSHGVARLDPATGAAPLITQDNEPGLSLAADATGVAWIEPYTQMDGTVIYLINRASF